MEEANSKRWGFIRLQVAAPLPGVACFIFIGQNIFNCLNNLTFIWDKCFYVFNHLDKISNYMFM